jgi:hypothetical protein
MPDVHGNGIIAFAVVFVFPHFMKQFLGTDYAALLL